MSLDSKQKNKHQILTQLKDFTRAFESVVNITGEGRDDILILLH